MKKIFIALLLIFITVCMSCSREEARFVQRCVNGHLWDGEFYFENNIKVKKDLTFAVASFSMATTNLLGRSYPKVEAFLYAPTYKKKYESALPFYYSWSLNFSPIYQIHTNVEKSKKGEIASIAYDVEFGFLTWDKLDYSFQYSEGKISLTQEKKNNLYNKILHLFGISRYILTIYRGAINEKFVFDNIPIHIKDYATHENCVFASHQPVGVVKNIGHIKAMTCLDGIKKPSYTYAQISGSFKFTESAVR